MLLYVLTASCFLGTFILMLFSLQAAPIKAINTGLAFDQEAHFLGMANAPIIFDDFDGSGPAIVTLEGQRALEQSMVDLIAVQKTLHIYQHPLIILINRECIDTSSLVSHHNVNDTMPIVRFTGLNSNPDGTQRTATLVNGNHRHAAVSKHIDNQDLDHKPYSVYLDGVQCLAENPSDTVLQEQVKRLKDNLISTGIWCIRFYDIGK